MIDRRDFMKQLAGAGALIATSQLPVFAEDKPEVFPQRGRYERLSMKIFGCAPLLRAVIHNPDIASDYLKKHNESHDKNNKCYLGSQYFLLIFHGSSLRPDASSPTPCGHASQ